MTPNDFVILARNCRRKEKSGLQEIFITLPAQKELKPFAAPRSEWLPENLGESLIWGGGGGCYVLNSRYVLLVERSHDAPSNPGKLTISSGLADNVTELYDPKRLIRELFEEVVLIDEQNCVLVPKFCGCNRWAERIARKAIAAIAPGKNHKMVPAQIMTTPMCDILHLASPEEEVSMTSCLSIDKTNQTLNVLFSVNLSLDPPLKKLRIQDTERSRGALLNRKIVLFDLHLQEYFAWPKLTVLAAKPELTDHARKLLAQLMGRT